MQATNAPEEDKLETFRPGGWALPYWADVMAQVQKEAMSSPYDLLLGRKTYELFAAHWPNVENDPIATMLNAAIKNVVTASPSGLDWNNSRAITCDIVSEVRNCSNGLC